MATLVRCDICGIKGAKRFQLTIRSRYIRGQSQTTRGAGSIGLCERCWKHVTDGRRYRPKGSNLCRSGRHELSGDNLRFHTDGHRICVACRREQQERYNAKKRAERAARGLQGRPWTDEQRLAHRHRMREWSQAVA